MKHLRFCIPLFLLFFINHYAASQWIRAANPQVTVPIAAQAVIAKGDTILVGTYQNTIFRSTDDGATWAKADAGLSPSLYETFAFWSSGDTVFAGTYDGVYRSYDFGGHWNLKDTGLVYPFFTYCFLRGGGRLFAGTEDGLFMSIDNGDSWIESDSGLTIVEATKTIESLSSADGFILAGTTDGIFRSSDSGKTWTAVNNQIPIAWSVYHTSVLAMFATSLGIFATTNGYGVFRSTDDGGTWEPETTGYGKQFNGSFFPAECSGSAGSKVFVGTQDGGLFESKDSGLTWSQANSGLDTSLYADDLFIGAVSARDSDVFIATFGGLYRGKISGTQWVPIFTSFLGTVEYYSVGGSGGNLIASTYADYDRGTITSSFISTNGGSAWNTAAGLGDQSVGRFIPMGSRLFALANDVLLSTNNGISWALADTGLGIFAHNVVELGGKLFAATGDVRFSFGEFGAVYAADADTLHWSSSGLNDTDIFDISSDDGVLLACGGRNVYRSIDTGKTWTVSSANLPAGIGAYSFARSGATVFCSNQRGIFTSVDDGSAWHANPSFPALDSANDNYISLFEVGGKVLASIEHYNGGAPNSSAYISLDEGTTWRQVIDNLPAISGSSWRFSVVGSNLYATAYDQLWYRPISEVLSAKKRINQVPASFGLMQNYPNPFNPVTTIRYELPRESLVRISVYNILGQEVRILVNEAEPAGYRSVSFDGAALASGMYFYRITAHQTTDGQTAVFTDVKKMVLVK